MDWILNELNLNLFILHKVNFIYLTINYYLNFFFENILNFEIGYFYQNGFFKNYFNFNIPLNNAFIYSLKFTISILFLIFIRAGLPRYRYDYLTKLGWNKFLIFALTISIFFFIIFFLI